MTVKIGEFRQALQELVSKPIAKVGVGGSTGSTFSLDIGDFRNGKGEYYLMARCAWRLDFLATRMPLTGWQEDSSLDGIMTIQLQKLESDVIQRIVLSDFCDLEMYLFSGKRLSLFCDLTPNVLGSFNWCFGNKQRYFSVNQYLNCVIEPTSSEMGSISG